jgi:hypothetical protein
VKTDEEKSLMRWRSTVSIAVLAAVLAAGCARKIDDGAIVTNLKAQMFSSPLLRSSDLQVKSSKGEVTLTGAVGSDAARLEAYKLASQTPGVIKVNDEMTVEAAPAPASDAQLPAIPTSQPAAPPSPSRKTQEKKKADQEIEQTQSAQNTPEPQPLPEPAPAPTPPAPSPQPAAAPPAPPQPKQIEIPANSSLVIRMIDGVDTKVNHAGEIFHASLESPLMVNDQVVVPSGADVYVRLSAASSAGHMTGKSELHMELLQLEFQGRSYPLVSGTYSAAGASRGKNTAAKVGGGAAVGAIIGAIAGGGKGAAIGAGVGGGGGAIWNGVTKGQQIKIPAETMLEFQLEQPVTITVRPRSTPAAQ